MKYEITEYANERIVFNKMNKPIIEAIKDSHIILHTHNYTEMYLWLSHDPVHFLLGDTIYEAELGSIFLVSPHTEHYAFTDIGNSYTRMKIGISQSVYSMFGRYDEILHKYGNTVFQADSATLSEMTLICDTVINAIRANTPETELSVILGCMQLLLTAYRLPSGNFSLQKRTYPRLLLDILHYISDDNRYLSIHGNREIAEHFYISETYIPRLFKQFYPISLHQLLLSKKIEYAKGLLRNGETVSEACYESGFKDCAYFIYVFRKLTGITPGEYKKSCGLSHDSL